MSSEADRIIALLDLKPHPEGGYFRETFRDEGAHKGRAHSTAILYLIRAGEVSRWHRLTRVSSQMTPLLTPVFLMKRLPN